LAARDFLRAGETFIDYKGQLHEILYAISTPLGYQAHVSPQALQHVDEQHSLPAWYQTELPHILNNPDLVAPNHEIPTAHLYYKVVRNILFVVAVHQKDELRYVATVHKTQTIKGLKNRIISQADFLYWRGGFKWKKWK